MSDGRTDNFTADARRVVGFTLTELLVVIAIIGLLLGVGVASSRALFRSGHIDAAINTISMAVASTRTLAVEDRSSGFIDCDPATPGDQEGDYSGMALIFTPAGELRVTVNVPQARYRSGELLELGHPTLTSGRPANGYADVPGIDYLQLPKDAAVVGLVRAGSSMRVYPPPFAIRFDERGNLRVAHTPGRRPGKEDINFELLVVYDGNYNGWFDIRDNVTARRYTTPIPYPPQNPTLFDPDSDRFDPDNWNEEAQKYELPFERLEAVIGVVIYRKSEFKDAGGDWGTIPQATAPEGYDNGYSGIRDWILENGTPLFFNRYTGAVIEEPQS